MAPARCVRSALLALIVAASACGDDGPGDICGVFGGACPDATADSAGPGDACAPGTPGCGNVSLGDGVVWLAPPVCGDGIVEAPESCDPPSACPVACGTADPCLKGTLEGNPLACASVCRYEPIAACLAGDGCCPTGCTSGDDGDCFGRCGDGVVEGGETCDPPRACVTSCDDFDPCTDDVLAGDAERCTAECHFTPVTLCTPGDGCCPDGCDGADPDCGPRCRTGTTWPVGWVTHEERAVEVMNVYRAEGATCVHDGVSKTYGPAGPLSMDEAAREAARCHSVDMAEQDFFEHTGSDGSQFWERMSEAGYTGRATSENIAAGYTDAPEVVAGWMASHDGHCNAIMDPGSNEVGIGYFVDPGSSWRHWWTADFGFRR